jgi:dihydroflavonol-4-reductase
MKVLVTGSTGFIGSSLCRALLERGHAVRAFHRPSSKLRLLDGLEVEHATGDLTQPETLEAAVQGVEVVFHAAAWMGGSEQNGRQYAITVEGTRSLLQEAQRASVRRVVHTSSVAALGVPEENQGTPALMDENHTWNYRPDLHPYGYAKYLAELEVQKAVSRGIDAVIVNPTLVFGRGDLYRQSSSIVTQVAERRLPVGVSGGLNCVHIDDVIEGHIAAMELGRTGERYILGGENLTFMEMLQTIASVTGAPAPDRALPTGLLHALSRPAHLFQSFVHLPVSADLLQLAGRFFYYDTRKAGEALGLTVRRGARQAFQEAYEWFSQIEKPAMPPVRSRGADDTQPSTAEKKRGAKKRRTFKKPGG